MTELFVLWVNPKAWTMTAAAAGGEGRKGESPFRLALLLGAVFGMAAAFSLTLWCTGGASLASVLKNETQWRIVNVILALVLAGSIIPMWR